MTPTITLHEGDCRVSLRRLIDQGVRVHSVVTDPPYGLVSVTKRFGKEGSAPAKHGTDGAFARASRGFMNREWDGTGIERDPEFWRLIYEILLPGGMVFAFSGARTGHRQACAMETAGFIMHPMHGWLNGSGMPKAHNPKLPGWEGWRYGAQTQKPALENVYLGQKPFSEKNGVLNLLKHGVGAFNVDGCRVPAEGRPLREVADFRDDVEYTSNSLSGRVDGSLRSSKAVGTTDLGRWPANLLHDDSEAVRAIFPDSKSDTGSAARFFNSFPTTEEDYLWAIDTGLIDDPEMTPAVYHGKATKADRAGSKHPTVKPIGLMEHFIRHITPPGGTVLDPFGGSGTTAEAARRLGMNAILMEAEPDYIAFLRERFNLDSPPETVTPRSTVSQFSRATVGADIMSFLT